MYRIYNVDHLLQEGQYVLFGYEDKFSEMELCEVDDVMRGDRLRVKLILTNKSVKYTTVVDQKFIQNELFFIYTVTKEEYPEYFL